jgi:predicted component of type VI protein secretion system
MALRSLHNWDAGRAGFPADPTLLANGARAIGQKLLHHHMSSRLVESGTAPLKPDLSDKPRAWFWPPALRFCNRVATLFSRGRRQAALPQTPSCRRTRRRSVSAWVAAGNPNVLREAEGLEDYSRKRKRGGRVKVGAISGVR